MLFWRLAPVSVASGLPEIQPHPTAPRIMLFGEPCQEAGRRIVVSIEAVCSSEAEVRKQIRLTVIHELGHYFGMDENQLKDA